MKTLTITITDIREELYDELWKDAVNGCKNEFGFDLKPTDSITINVTELAKQTDMQTFSGLLTDVFSGIITAYTASEINKAFSKDIKK